MWRLFGFVLIDFNYKQLGEKRIVVFSSILFLFYFLPITLILYYIVPFRYKNAALFLVSLVFYSWGEPTYIFLMLATTLYNYGCGLLLGKFQKENRPLSYQRAVVAAAVVGDLSVLGFFKYGNFITGNIASLLHLDISVMNIALPIGISFYTFQALSYVIDVYRKQASAQKNFISFGTYITMFPQLIAGPIVRYNSIAYELSNRRHNMRLFSDGVCRFTVGLSKKVLLANNIGQLFDVVRAATEQNMSVSFAWLGIVAYAFQIYFDFSGYSDMAIGLGKMFGFHLDENFNYPYISKSITEFWRRWHISLSTWFKEYLYIPLGGNRKGKWRTIFNLFIVWFATGFWHGANWNFILWGLYYFVFLVIEKQFLKKYLEKAPAVVGHIYTLLIVAVGWAIFALDQSGEIAKFFGYMFGRAPLVSQSFFYYVRNYALVLVCCILASMPLAKQWFRKLTSRFNGMCVLRPILVACGLFLCIVYLVDSSYNPFLYFRF